MMLGTILNFGNHRETDPDSWYFLHFSLMVTDGCWSGQMRSAMYDALAQLLCHRQCGRSAGCEVSVFSTSAYTMASLCLLCPPLLSPLWPKRVGACPCQCLLTAGRRTTLFALWGSFYCCERKLCGCDRMHLLRESYRSTTAWLCL